MEFKHIMRSFFLLLTLVVCGCSPKKVEVKPKTFETLMGSQLPAWKHVQTEEDFQNLAFFKKVFEKNIEVLQVENKEEKIPKVLHFIWLGPKAFPRESIENVRTWIAKNPDWTVKFWTDRERPLPHPKMEKHFVQEFPFLKLKSLFHRSDNYAEQSDLLRLEILYKEGGVYADHDVKCLQSFDPLNKSYDLFCGLEVPYPTTLSSSISPTNNLLGSKPNHPMLLKCMDWLIKNWDWIEESYPGRDRDAVINRISHRTFFVLGEMFKKNNNADGNIDIAFPSYYFNAPNEKDALYAQHQYRGTWFENETAFEKMARKRLMMLSKKTNKLLLALGVLAFLNLIGFSYVTYLIIRRKNA